MYLFFRSFAYLSVMTIWKIHWKASKCLVCVSVDQPSFFVFTVLVERTQVIHSVSVESTDASIFSILCSHRRRHRMHAAWLIFWVHVSRTQMISDCLPLLEWFLFSYTANELCTRRKKKRQVENNSVQSYPLCSLNSQCSWISGIQFERFSISLPKA